MKMLSLLVGLLSAWNAVAQTLSAPGSSKPSGETTSQITWNWVSVTGSEGYRVYDSLNGTNVLQTIKGAATTAWTEKGLTAGTRYTRYVTAYSGINESARTQLPSAMASYQVTWHPTSSLQSQAIADTYIADGFPSNSFAAEDILRCGYSALTSPYNRRSLVQFEGFSLPSATLWCAGNARASIRLYATVSGGNNADIIRGYRVSADWDETNAVPTWTSFFTATNSGSFTSQNVQGSSAWYHWDWDPLVAGMPDNRRGVMFVNDNEKDNAFSKGFASRDNATPALAPTMSLDYYLPVNPGWVTQMLVLPGVGTNSLDAAPYAANAGLMGDIDLYGSSKHTYGTKTWQAATGDTTDAVGFSDHYGWNLVNPPFSVGANTCTLFNLYVFSDTAASGCYLRCGSGDGVRLIVNDTIVGTDDALSRTWAMDQSVFGPFSLSAGWNRVLLKVRRSTGTTGLKAVRFSNADATVWSGSTLRFAVDDTTAPGNPTGCTESGGALSGQWQSSWAAPSFVWAGAADIAATDEGAAGIRGYKVYYGTSADGTPSGFQTNAACAPSAQAEGVYYLRVSTVDNALNESQAVTLFSYACDRTPPTGVSLGFGSVTPNSVTVTGTGTDSLSGIDAGRGYVYHFGDTSDSGQQGVSYTWTGLAPNTLYSDFSVTVSDKASNAATSAKQSKWTLSVPPGAGSVVSGDSSPCANSPVPWTAPAGFGAGAVQYYRYAWDQAVSHQWTGSEPQWSSGRLSTTPTAGGTWYLHIQGYNGEHVGNGSYDYAIAVNASPLAQSKSLSAWKNKSATITVGKLLAGATGAASVSGVSTATTGASVRLADGMVTYVPPADFTGTDSFTFTLVSSAECYGNGTVTVTVSEGNGEGPNVVYTGTEGNDFVARFAGIPGETYTIEAANGANGPWQKLGANVVVPSTDQGWGVGVFELRDPMTNGLGFYRTVWPAY